MSASATHAAAQRQRAAREVAETLIKCWSFSVAEDGAVLTVASPGARPVPLTPAIVSAGATLESIGSRAEALSGGVARDAALLLEGLVRLGHAGVDIGDAFR